MINMLRKIVAGPKNKTQWEDSELDLTYITDRIIAMAFPASGIEKTYRNSIKDVSRFLREKHTEYLVVNASNRKYEYEQFQNQVKEYFWPDHQAPPLSTIFQICSDMLSFLSESKDGVVCVHCNHGKGRTGTAIISFILYVGFYKKVEEVLKFYNKKRFSSEKYSVDQPCQLRYLKYTEQIAQIARENSPNFKRKLKIFKLCRIQSIGLSNDYYLHISLTRTGETKYNKINLNNKSQIDQQAPLVGDIFIQLFKDKWNGNKRVSRMNANLFFVQKSQEQKQYCLHFEGKNIKVSGDHHKNFSLAFYFIDYCLCQKEKKLGCKCIKQRDRQNFYWERLIKSAQKCQHFESLQACRLLYFPQQVSYCELPKQKS